MAPWPLVTQPLLPSHVPQINMFFFFFYTAYFTSTLVVTLHLRPLRSTDCAGMEPCLHSYTWSAEHTPRCKHGTSIPVDFMWRHYQSTGERPYIDSYCSLLPIYQSNFGIVKHKCWLLGHRMLHDTCEMRCCTHAWRMWAIPPGGGE